LPLAEANGEKQLPKGFSQKSNLAKAPIIIESHPSAKADGNKKDSLMQCR